MLEEKCVFCDIVAGQAPAHIVFEDELSLGLLDINPLAEGHCLIIPKRHVPWWHDLTVEETRKSFQGGQEWLPKRSCKPSGRILSVCMPGEEGFPTPIFFWSPPPRAIPWTDFSTHWKAFRKPPRS